MTDIAITADAEPQAPFSWKWLLFSLRGRATRSQYWLRFTLPMWIISIFLMFIDMAAGTMDYGTGLGLLSGIFGLAVLWPSIAVTAKRLHDRDKSGWWMLMLLIPFIGFIWFLIVVGCLRGTRGPNRFGPDPLET